MAARKKRNWIKGAVSKHPGALRRKAKRAGESTAEYAQEHRNSPGRTGKQARLALTLRKMSRGKKRKGKRTKKRSARR